MIFIAINFKTFIMIDNYMNYNMQVYNSQMNSL